MSDQVKESSIKTADISMDLLVLNENNTNEMSKSVFERLCQEIRDNGFLDPIDVVPVSDGKYMILGGEHRFKAAQEVGMTFIPCSVHDNPKFQNKDTFDLMTFKLNTLRGKTNLLKFIPLYERMVALKGVDKVQESMAISDDGEWKRLTKGIEKGMKSAGFTQETIDHFKNAGMKPKSSQSLTKLIKQAMQSQAVNPTAGVLIFRHGDVQHAIFNCPEETIQSVALLSDWSKATGKDCAQAVKEAIESFLATKNAQ